MENFFPIGKTAKMVGMTTETLRHYDRIGLVHPCQIDKWTGYRYYSEQEVVRLHTVHALRCMGLSLHKIKKVLEFKDIENIVAFLKQAEQNADKKIAELKEAKTRIQRAEQYYKSKTTEQPKEEVVFLREIPQRTILLSDHLSTPSVENLWNYHRHFYAQIGEDKKEDFSFEDIAGIYEAGGRSFLFAVCSRYSEVEGLLVLPAGKYLCVDCTEEKREKALHELLDTAETQYAATPDFVIYSILLSGILQWNYQIQVLVESNHPS